MQMDKDTIKKFPKLYQYVSCQMPRVKDVKIIMSNIKKLAGKLTDAQLTEALAWGKGPTIKVVKDLMCSGKKSFGCYSWGSNELRIDEAMVREFEAGRGLRRTKYGKMVYLVGVTLLHELTHWADAQDGVDDAIPGDPSNEEGERYEERTYGKIID